MIQIIQGLFDTDMSRIGCYNL